MEHRYLAMSTIIDSEIVTSGTGVQTSTLGSLLQSHRVAIGSTLQELSTTTGLPMPVIESVEAGDHDLDIEALAGLIEAYAPPTLVGSHLADVVVDIETVSVALVESTRVFADLPPADRILGHYLDFVYADRDLPMGTRLSIREVDLSVVRDSLALRRDAVSGHIERLEDAPTGSIDRTHLVLLTGLLCATTAFVVGGGTPSEGGRDGVPDAIAAVVVVEDAPIVTPGDVVVQIGSAVSITRAPAEIEAPAAGQAVSVEIGTAVVEER